MIENSVSMQEPNALFNLATRVINHTGRHLFLTGRAGTGKTTFLRHIQRTTPKKTIVVAPTGVAAINAGGVTMHSFFQLPLGMYIADASNYFGDEYTGGLVVNKHSLFKNIRFNRDKIDLLRELELLIIDEVSMLRADALDAIDTILRHFRRRHREPFGGVQVLYIGDLFQLPPVIRQEEASLFYEHYRSPFFFDAHAIAEDQPLVIELKQIYRQSDADFIHILNAIRNNKITEEELDTLHLRYNPYVQPEEGVIVLTTHNHKADAINAQRLESLPGRVQSFEGVISGEFNEKALPAERLLQLKVGAQVMFIKNDKGESRRYYNGKLATVQRMDEDGEVWVRLAGSDEELKLEQHTWKSIRYRYNQDKDDIDEEELGSYKQYPVRLAWAITIHKSQGLTFERAIVDAGKSFAAGQVYVALSRMTSLNGLILHSRIPAQGIEMPEAIISFCKKELDEQKLHELVLAEEAGFAQLKLVQWFSFAKLISAWSSHQEAYQSRAIPSGEAAIAWSHGLLQAILKLEETAARFRTQLESLLGVRTDYDAVSERVKAAHRWFADAVETEILQPLVDHYKAWGLKPRTKKYLAELRLLEGNVLQLRKGLQQAEWLACGLAGGIPFKEISLDASAEPSRLITSAPEAAGKPKKGESFTITLAMHREGKSAAEIAAARDMAESTIEGHLVKLVAEGAIPIEDLVPPDKMVVIKKMLEQEDAGSLTEIKERLGDEYSFGMIRSVIAHLGAIKARSPAAAG